MLPLHRDEPEAGLSPTIHYLTTGPLRCIYAVYDIKKDFEKESVRRCAKPRVIPFEETRTYLTIIFQYP
jgi:hypothetical protein